MLELLSFEGVNFGFKSLAHDNYPQWKASMRQLLSIQGIWEIVNGQVTKSELNHQGYELRDRLALALIRAAIDLHVHPWVSGQFTSSKELWDFIDCKLQRKKKHKTKKKKKEKKHEYALNVTSELSKFTLSVSIPDEATHSENAKQIYQIIAPIIKQDNLLTLHNYEEWRFHMTWSLISQGLWHVVRGQNWSDITLEKDDIVFRSIMYTIDDSLRSKILPSSFLSAKELWDYLRLQIEQSHDLAYDHVQQGFKAKTVSSDISNCMLPVPEIHDFISDSSCFGNILEEATSMGNAQVLDQSDLLPAANTSMLPLHAQDTLHLSIDIDKHYSIPSFQSCEGEHHNLYQILEYCSLDSESIQVCMPEQLELPCFDSEFDTICNNYCVVKELWEDVAALSNPERALKACCFDLEMVNLQQEGNSQSILFDHDLQHEMLDNTCLLDNNENIDQFHRDDQCAGNKQGVMEAKEELVCELPWLDIDSKTCNFQSIIFQVSQYALDLPLYMNISIPFACPHEEIIKDHASLAECLGYVARTDIQGISQILKVSFECLHLRNQVLLIVDMAEDQNMFDYDVQSGTWSQDITRQFSEFQSDISNGSKDNYKFSVHKWQSHMSFTAELIHRAFYMFLVMKDSYIDKSREWYRGRQIWFRTNISWQAWLFLWLTLLHMLNSSTGVLSLQQCSSSGGVLDLCWLVSDDITLLTRQCTPVADVALHACC